MSSKGVILGNGGGTTSKSLVIIKGDSLIKLIGVLAPLLVPSLSTQAVSRKTEWVVKPAVSVCLQTRQECL